MRDTLEISLSNIILSAESTLKDTTGVIPQTYYLSGTVSVRCTDVNPALTSPDYNVKVPISKEVYEKLHKELAESKAEETRLSGTASLGITA